MYCAITVLKTSTPLVVGSSSFTCLCAMSQLLARKPSKSINWAMKIAFRHHERPFTQQRHKQWREREDWGRIQSQFPGRVASTAACWCSQGCSDERYHFPSVCDSHLVRRSCIILQVWASVSIVLFRGRYVMPAGREDRLIRVECSLQSKERLNGWL